MFRLNMSLKVMLSACAALQLSGCIATHSAFSKQSQAQGNASCAQLFSAPEFEILKGKMPTLPGQAPTRDMIVSNAPITEEEGQAVQALENAIRACKTLRANAGIPTSATEDIVEQRLSNLRYGLFKGEIPFAVYNYGLAKALRDQAKFRNSGVTAAERGRQIGAQKTAQMLQKMEQEARMQQLEGQLHAYNNRLNAYNNSINSYNNNLRTYNNNMRTYNNNMRALQNKTWSCSSSGINRYTCR